MTAITPPLPPLSAESPAPGLRRLPVYNPRIQTDAEVVAGFVARRALFEELMQDLRKEPAQGRAQPHLIIGARGMGKTTLLMRLAAELRRPEFAGRFVPLVFAEEQYSVDRLSKFWLNCLDSLADVWQKRGESQRLAEIDSTVARCAAQGRGLSRDQDAPLATTVFEELVRLTGNERPVLLVDNVQLMFERLTSQQQHALRQVLMRAGGPVLMAAAPHPVLETQDYGAPFYDLFKTHWLAPLSADEMRELLVELARLQGKTELAGRVAAQPGRLKTLHLLTGGNPRAAVLLFHLYAEGLSSHVYSDLEGVLDLVTPLYKARFEELAPQMQMVAAALAEAWDPCTARQLADLTSLPITQISPQLQRLAKLGFIEPVELAGGDQGWQIAERLFNLWYLMRLASRRQRRGVEFLTRFLEVFFEPEPNNASGAGHSTELGPLQPTEGLRRLAATPRHRSLEHFSSPSGQLAEPGGVRGIADLDLCQTVPSYDLVFLQRDELSDIAAATRIFFEIPEPVGRPERSLWQLQRCLFAAQEANWGDASTRFAAALDLVEAGFPAECQDDWMRASAVLIHLGYGARLLELLEQRGENVRLRPWFEAVRAAEANWPELLRNVAPEVRLPAEKLLSQIEQRLARLPASTRRRPAAVKSKRRGRKP